MNMWYSPICFIENLNANKHNAYCLNNVLVRPILISIVKTNILLTAKKEQISVQYDQKGQTK